MIVEKEDIQRRRMEQCITILELFPEIRRRISNAGMAGIPRKMLVAEIDKKHGWDDGMTRRAVLRWLDSPRSDAMKIPAPSGVLYCAMPESDAQRDCLSFLR